MSVAEFKALLCGMITLVTAASIVRDLVVGISGISGVYPFGLGSNRGVGLFADNSLRYVKAERPIGFSLIIILKIALMIFFGAETLHFIGFVAADPLLTLKRMVRP